MSNNETITRRTFECRARAEVILSNGVERTIVSSWGDERNWYASAETIGRFTDTQVIQLNAAGEPFGVSVKSIRSFKESREVQTVERTYIKTEFRVERSFNE